MRIFSLIKQNTALLNKIYSHSFNQRLYQGTLPSAIFRNFLEQDRLYLLDYAKALGLFTARLTNETYIEYFNNFAKDTVSLEQKIQVKYLKKLPACGFFSGESQRIQKIPVIAKYTEHLLWTCQHAPIEEAAVCIIPCPWIYKELGEQMDLSCCSPNHPYIDWIATYKDEEFITATMKMIDIAEALVEEEFNKESCSAQKERKMAESILKSTQFEHDFFEEISAWDKGYPLSPVRSMGERVG